MSDTGGIAGDRLRSFIERVERLEEDRSNLNADIREVYSEAKSAGFDAKTMRAIVRLRACERTAPWELTPEHGAFVQLLVNDRPATRSGEDKFRKVFSGWLFRESPSLNVVEHPIYDVWVKKCEMSFPGEEEPVADS